METKPINSIEIDIGGTFIDCFVHFEGNTATAKTPTTFDFSVGFMRVLKIAANQLRLKIEHLLSKTDIIRYSTTIARNKLLERTGPELGLITTEGFEDSVLIGKGAQWADGISKRDARNLAEVTKPQPLISRENIVGIKERVDYRGELLRPLQEEDLREKLHQLVDKGVQGIVVTLLWAHKNPFHELRTREIIEEEYPESSIGYLPVVLSHEVQPLKGEYKRSLTAILNAYLRPSLAENLSSIRNKLHKQGYKGEIYIVHGSGGVAEIRGTTALETFKGGSVAGIIGSLEIARHYSLENVIVADMGGTSFDIGIISNGKSQLYWEKPLIDQWTVNSTLIESKSIGAGGGSIARISQFLGKKLEIGPESAGSMPGPACYNQGGVEPTVTDADVVLGYINPAFFHGGQFQLERDLAEQAIYEKIAHPLGIDVEEAAINIKNLVDGNMGNVMFKETHCQGLDPRNFTLFSYGGAGPTHCCGIVKTYQISHIIIFPFSPFFNAFSASLMDILHIDEFSRKFIVSHPGEKGTSLDIRMFNQAVKKMIEKAKHYVLGQRFKPQDLQFYLELDMKYTKQLHLKRVRSPILFFQDDKDVEKLLEVFTSEYSKIFGQAGILQGGGISIETLILQAVCPLKNAYFPKYKRIRSTPLSHAKKGLRNVHWDEYGGYKQTAIYDYHALECGNIIDGPAVIEARDMTIVLPLGFTFTIDLYMNNHLERLE
ncbi:hydantoinase/oxoprolinase family protein [Desulfobacula sp.]|uniref:hydantoinase/oxoprolinase family protein n=1 Tax=Desulfobacula sp. TaxID=2593537 RepID=UPI00260C3EB8|nr:hydantoinase/oxoprolinase family protein [Desulfobacula sp.]